MAPIRTKKPGPDESISSAQKRAASDLPESPSTPQRSPIKKRKLGISLQQKQALIENLRLEITERARRLRAQYHLQAQGLRSRVEIRINRIPTALRRLKMGDLLVKYAEQEQEHQQRASARPPPLPAKDVPSRLNPQKPTQQLSRVPPAGRGQKRLSDEITGDKENEMENVENPKKKVRGADAAPVRPTQVLSPTTSNSRLANRDRPISPIKSQIAKPSSPLKAIGATRSAVATSVLSSMVEKAKATRAGGARKVTTASTVSSSSNSSRATTATRTTAATRTRRAAATTAPKAPVSRPATRMTRRASANSESSEASTNTVVRKTGATKAATAATKKTVMGGIKKGVSAMGTKASAAKTTAPTSTNTSGRVLRKRG